jgi:hypothetical protein
MRRYNAEYQVQAYVRNDSDVVSATAWVPIADWMQILRVHFKAASAAGANDGRLTLYVDGVERGAIQDVDNDSKSIGLVKLGVLWPTGGTSGSVYFDHFVSGRTVVLELLPGLP